MLAPVHPGEVLKEEFMVPLGISVNSLARTILVPPNRIAAIVNGTRGVSAESALRLAKVFGTTPNFWLNLQNAYDLDLVRQELPAENENGSINSKEVAKVHLRKLVRGVFEGEPTLRTSGRGSDLKLEVDWNLGTDPARPNKRSVGIEIILTEEFIDDYCEAIERERHLTDEHVYSFIKEKLKHFMPEHDVPKNIPPPLETWVINSSLMRYS